MGDVENSRTCFGLLNHASTSPSVRDEVDYWYARGLINAERYNELKTLGETKLVKLDGEDHLYEALLAEDEPVIARRETELDAMQQRSMVGRED